MRRRFAPEPSTRHTVSGTPAYAAPEVLAGRPTRWSDQYSLAASWCELRGGQPPFTGAPADLLAGHLHGTPYLGGLPEAISEYRAAIAEYQSAARGEPDQWEAHFNLGLAYGQITGREADAIAELQTALRIRPDSPLSHFHLGNMFHKLGRLPAAIAEYREAARLDPSVPEVHYELAYALAQIPGKVPEAIAECQKMIALKPEDEPGRQLMASLLAFQNGGPR